VCVCVCVRVCVHACMLALVAIELVTLYLSFLSSKGIWKVAVCRTIMAPLQVNMHELYNKYE
jgi:hypothetical protein